MQGTVSRQRACSSIGEPKKESSLLLLIRDKEEQRFPHDAEGARFTNSVGDLDPKFSMAGEAVHWDIEKGEKDLRKGRSGRLGIQKRLAILGGSG